MSLLLPADAADRTSYRHALDLRLCWSVHPRGDLTVWITWLRTTGEACLVLTPRHRPISHERTIPCIVPLARAWAWAEETGDPLDTLRAAGRFAANLGLDPLAPRDVMRVVSAVRDHLGDLLACPPMPPSPDRYTAAEITLTDRETGRVVEREAREDA